MASPVFFDTNIVVYAHDHRETTKHPKATALLREAVRTGSARISSQVIQEFCHVALIKKAHFLNPKDLKDVLEYVLLPLMKHVPTGDFFKRGLDVFSDNSLSFYDALIIQAAMDLGCSTLYSEDLQDGQKFGKLTIVNPFK